MSPSLMISIALYFAVTSLLAIVGFSAMREGTRPLGYWLFAWTGLFAAAAFVLVSLEFPGMRPLVYASSSVAGPLMLMGAYAHVERRIPRWLLAAGIFVAAVRILGFETIGTDAADLAAVALEPPFVVAAGWLILRSKPQMIRPSGDVILALSFWLYAVAEFAGPLLRYSGFSDKLIWANWLGLGLPLLMTQLVLYVGRLGRIVARSEQQTHSVEQRLRIITESTDSVVVEYDAFGTLTYLSENAAPRPGTPVETLIGRNALEFFESDANSPIAHALAERGYLVESDVFKAPRGPARVLRPDGSIAYYEVHRMTYETDEGDLRFLSQAHDVSERISDEETIRDSERLLNRAEQIGNFGSWEFFPEIRRFSWSAHLFRMHGLEPISGLVDPKLIEPLILSGDFMSFFEHGTEFSKATQIPETNYLVRRATDGEIRHFRAVGEIEFDEDGKIERITGASRDVTEQEELEATLRRGREHLDALVDSNIVGVFFSDPSGKITRANQAFLSLVGFSQADLPLDWRSISSDGEIPTEAFNEVGSIETESSIPFEQEFRSRSGDSISMLIGCARLDEDQSLVIAVDLSERKRTERLIAKHQQELEETVAERTRELVESRGRLLEAERLAAVGILTAGVAHQINNPIGAILNSAEYAMLCEGDDDAMSVFRSAIETNLLEARRCARIVRSMLQFSRDQSTEKWVHDLNQVTRHAHRAISAYAKDRGAKISISAPSQPIHAMISPIEIEQALVNVLRNAIESRDSGASISLSLRQQDQAAEIEVLDDGCGIGTRVRDHLFEPFFSTRTREGGTGLGLSVAHGIVKDHGGEIRVESTPSEGTRIAIRIPIVDAPQDAPQDSPRDAVQGGRAAARSEPDSPDERPLPSF